MRTIFRAIWSGSRSLGLAGVLILSSAALTCPPDLAGLTREFRTADAPEARIALLQEMADVPEASPDMLAAALSRGLEAGSFLVRAKAATLLGALIDSDAALTALLDAGQSFAKDRAAAMQVPKLDVPKLGDKDGLDKLREMQEQLDAQAEQLKGLAEYERELVEALLSSKDERCIDAFGQLLQTLPLDPYGKNIVKWLFEVGTTSALGEVVNFIPVTDKVLKSRAKERKKLARTRPERVPRYWKGTKDAWAARESSRINALLSGFDDVTRRVEERHNQFGALVRDLVKKTDLAPPPSTMDARAWLKWWRAEKPRLLESFDR